MEKAIIAGEEAGDTLDSSELDEQLVLNDKATLSKKPNDIINYYRETFRKRVCNQFVVNVNEKKNASATKDNLYCRCGLKKCEHEPGVSEDQSIKEWSPDKNTDRVPTDAFGEIEFPNHLQKLCKYIRVGEDTNEEDLVDMMLKHWKMEKPNLLISVTGGALNFPLKPQLKEVFRHGLIKAAVSTGAWIITGGTNAGVMKYVGEAIRDMTIARGSANPIVAIGVATWGCINNRQLLVNKDGCWPAEYKSNETRSPSLDPNHSHFILVDDGTANQFGVEIDLRGKLERQISKMKALGVSVTVPVICIVLEGGPNTIKTVKTAIDAETPVIIVQGSGRAADIFAYAYDQTTRENSEEHETQTSKSIASFEGSVFNAVKRMIMKMDPRFTDKQGDEYTRCVEACLSKRDYITVFKLNDNRSARDIDVVILKALLKVNGGNGSLDQLNLALAWNRIDVAREEIFTDEVEIEPRKLENLMYAAIVNNRVDFVNFFLEKGVDMKNFVTSQRLTDLYNEDMVRKRCPQLYKMAKKRTSLSLYDVGVVMKKLISNSFKPLYCDVKYKTANVSDTFDDPGKELFTWCIFTQMRELAMIFWQVGRDDLALSLHAQLLMKNMMNHEDFDSDTQYLELINFYNDQAVNVLDECYSSDSSRASQLLVRTLSNFDGITALQMAVDAGNMEFISHPACQNLLTQIWMGSLTDDNSTLSVLICVLLPFLAPLVLKYRKGEIGLSASGESSAKISESFERQDSLSPTEESLGTTTNPKYFQQIWLFLLAPIVKFSYYCVFYVAFLVLYAIILLTDFRPIVDIKETVLVIWISTMVLEEIRQLIMDDAGTLRQKLQDYILTDYWNILDVVSISTYILGFVMRCMPSEHCPDCFYAGRIILALNLMMFFVRVLHLFSIHRELGPKLVMIGRMMINLFYFVIVWLVFIIGYGVVSQVILYPNQPLSIQLAREVFSTAWWNVFGDLNIDEVSGNNCPVDDGSRNYTAKECARYGYDSTDSALCWGKSDQCVAIDWLVPILLALYSLVTNVMMLNLLIAMFSNTFSEIQDKSNVVWKTQRYHLVREFYSRPMLPPPLIIFSHISLFIRYHISSDILWILKESTETPFKVQFDDRTDKELVLWQNANTDEYLRKLEEGDQKKLENRFSEVEEQMKRSSEALDWIISNQKKITRQRSMFPSQPSLDIDVSDEFRDRLRAIEENARLASMDMMRQRNIQLESENQKWENCIEQLKASTGQQQRLLEEENWRLRQLLADKQAGLEKNCDCLHDIHSEICTNVQNSELVQLISVPNSIVESEHVRFELDNEHEKKVSQSNKVKLDQTDHASGTSSKIIQMLKRRDRFDEVDADIHLPENNVELSDQDGQIVSQNILTVNPDHLGVVRHDIVELEEQGSYDNKSTDIAQLNYDYQGLVTKEILVTNNLELEDKQLKLDNLQQLGQAEIQKEVAIERQQQAELKDKLQGAEKEYDKKYDPEMNHTKALQCAVEEVEQRCERNHNEQLQRAVQEVEQSCERNHTEELQCATEEAKQRCEKSFTEKMKHAVKEVELRCERNHNEELQRAVKEAEQRYERNHTEELQHLVKEVEQRCESNNTKELQRAVMEVEQRCERNHIEAMKHAVKEVEQSCERNHTEELQCATEEAKQRCERSFTEKMKHAVKEVEQRCERNHNEELQHAVKEAEQKYERNHTEELQHVVKEVEQRCESNNTKELQRAVMEVEQRCERNHIEAMKHAVKEVEQRCERNHNEVLQRAVKEVEQRCERNHTEELQRAVQEVEQSCESNNTKELQCAIEEVKHRCERSYTEKMKHAVKEVEQRCERNHNEELKCAIEEAKQRCERRYTEKMKHAVKEVEQKYERNYSEELQRAVKEVEQRCESNNTKELQRAVMEVEQRCERNHMEEMKQAAKEVEQRCERKHMEELQCAAKEVQQRCERNYINDHKEQLTHSVTEFEQTLDRSSNEPLGKASVQHDATLEILKRDHAQQVARIVAEYESKISHLLMKHEKKWKEQWRNSIAKDEQKGVSVSVHEAWQIERDRLMLDIQTLNKRLAHCQHRHYSQQDQQSALCEELKFLKERCVFLEGERDRLSAALDVTNKKLLQNLNGSQY